MEDDKGIYERALKRERAARKSAEKILEEKASELYELNQEIKAKNLILEQNFASKERELQDLFKNLVEGYVIANLDGFVLKMNDSAKAIFEVKPTGSFNLNSLVREEEIDNLQQGLAVLLRDKSLSDFELKIVTHAGTAKTIFINASSVKDTNGTTIALQALIRDVTEVRKLEADRETLLVKLKQKNQELEEYAHVISHDLKSPLRNLYTLNTWIKESLDKPQDAQVTEYFSMIFTTLERMDNMIHEILNFSKSDKDAMNFEKVDMNAMLVSLQQQYLTRENLQLSITGDFPATHGVRVKLFQVFQNLIDNAIKFNDKSTTEIKISFEDLGPDRIKVTVYDNGRGITPLQQRKVFKLFETTEKDQSSSGVGLAIVKKILDAHQSEIILTSEVGVFTQFEFDLKKAT